MTRSNTVAKYCIDCLHEKASGTFSLLQTAEFGILSLTTCNSQTIQDYGKIFCTHLEHTVAKIRAKFDAICMKND